jgi:CrcB protein
MLWQLLLVGAGGFAGSVCRFGVGRLAYGLWPGATLPYGTLAVNVAGCFLIGLLTGWFAGRGGPQPALQLLLFTGFLGGFTTFSAFGYETMALAREVTVPSAALNVVLHLGAGLTAVWAGASVFR